MANQLKGFDAWGKAIGLLLTFMSVRAAFHAIRQAEGTAPESETVKLLRSIDRKLPELSDIDYNELL